MSQSALPQFSLRFDEALNQRLRKYCDETGIPMSEFIRRAIIAMLDRAQDAELRRSM